jgi:hypothetical protein
VTRNLVQHVDRERRPGGQLRLPRAVEIDPDPDPCLQRIARDFRRFALPSLCPAALLDSFDIIRTKPRRRPARRRGVSGILCAVASAMECRMSRLLKVDRDRWWPPRFTAGAPC